MFSVNVCLSEARWPFPLPDRVLPSTGPTRIPSDLQNLSLHAATVLLDRGGTGAISAGLRCLTVADQPTCSADTRPKEIPFFELVYRVRHNLISGRAGGGEGETNTDVKRKRVPNGRGALQMT